MKSAAAVVPDPTDVCSFGHQLAPGSETMVLRTYGEDGQLLGEETKLLRNHACVGPKGIYAGGTRFPAERGMRNEITVPEHVDGADAQDHGLGRTDPTRLIPYPCAHALTREEVDDESITATAGAVPGLAGSFGRAHWLTIVSGVPPIGLIAKCPVCLGQPAPDWRA